MTLMHLNYGEAGGPIRVSAEKPLALLIRVSGQPTRMPIAWTWCIPVGGGIELVLGVLLAIT